LDGNQIHWEDRKSHPGVGQAKTNLTVGAGNFFHQTARQSVRPIRLTVQNQSIGDRYETFLSPHAPEELCALRNFPQPGATGSKTRSNWTPALR